MKKLRHRSVPCPVSGWQSQNSHQAAWFQSLFPSTLPSTAHRQTTHPSAFKSCSKWCTNMSSRPSFRKEKPLQCFNLFTKGNWVLTKSLEGLKGVGSRLGLQKLFPEPEHQTGPPGGGSHRRCRVPDGIAHSIQGSRNCYPETAPQHPPSSEGCLHQTCLLTAMKLWDTGELLQRDPMFPQVCCQR